MSLTELHDIDENLPRIAATLIIVRASPGIDQEIQPPRGLCGEQRNKAFVKMPFLCAWVKASSYFEIASMLNGSTSPNAIPIDLTLVTC